MSFPKAPYIVSKVTVPVEYTTVDMETDCKKSILIHDFFFF